MKKISIHKLFQQSFEGHEGRIGKRGGSLPRKSSGGEKGGSSTERFDKQAKPVAEKFALSMKKEGKRGTTSLEVDGFHVSGMEYHNPKNGDSGILITIHDDKGNSAQYQFDYGNLNTDADLERLKKSRDIADLGREFTYQRKRAKLPPES
jgi:hypothetical protein